MTAAEYASVRDIPRSCTCSWRYALAPARWVLARPDPECPWHLIPAARLNGGTT